jgi:hypothetical protein
VLRTVPALRETRVTALAASSERQRSTADACKISEATRASETKDRCQKARRWDMRRGLANIAGAGPGKSLGNRRGVVSKFHINWQKSLAELVTIILGVLIALAANDWRDTVRDHAEATGYEARLDEAVGSDIRQYAQAASWAAAIDSAAVEVLAVYRGHDVAAGDAKEFVEAVLKASWMPPPSVSRDTYDDLVSTGSLALLPVAVREAIDAYYGQAQIYADREALFRQVLTRGYWNVPAMVLGPDVLPRLWKAMDAAQQGDQQQIQGLTVAATQLDAIVKRLRHIPDLEAEIADVRHVMVQREVNYADHMTTAAKQLRQVLQVEK